MINPQLQRDPNSNAVLNTDVTLLNKYKAERKLYRKVEMLAKELDEVKATLKNICVKLEEIETK